MGSVMAHYFQEGVLDNFHDEIMAAHWRNNPRLNFKPKSTFTRYKYGIWSKSKGQSFTEQNQMHHPPNSSKGQALTLDKSTSAPVLKHFQKNSDKKSVKENGNAIQSWTYLAHASKLQPHTIAEEVVGVNEDANDMDDHGPGIEVHSEETNSRDNFMALKKNSCGIGSVDAISVKKSKLTFVHSRPTLEIVGGDAGATGNTGDGLAVEGENFKVDVEKNENQEDSHALEMETNQELFL